MTSAMKIRALAAGVLAWACLLAGCGPAQEKSGPKSKPASAEAPTVAAETPAETVPVAVKESPVPDSRELEFPSDRSLGSLRTYDAATAQWLNLGEAKGKVAVPKGAGVTLIVTAEGARDLSALASMPADAFRQIVLDEIEVADDQLAHLAGLKGLQKISLRAAQVTDAGVAALGEIENLSEIDLAMTPVTDAVIPALAKLKQLDTFDISATNVGDGAIPDLSTMTSLRTLDPQRSKITAEGVLKIIEALPDCTIVER